MTNVYTIEDWKKDGELNPKLFQEVDHEIYSEMYEVLPPYPLEKATKKILENQLGIKFIQTFCVGEAYTTDDDDPESNQLEKGGKMKVTYFMKDLNRYLLQEFDYDNIIKHI